MRIPHIIRDDQIKVVDLRKGVGAVCQVKGINQVEEKKGEKVQVTFYIFEHALPKCPGGGRGFPRWLRLVSPLIQSRCILCYLRCWGRRGELVCLSTLETLSIILFQVHIWSVLTGASETILRGHTSPTAAAVIYAVFTV